MFTVYIYSVIALEIMFYLNLWKHCVSTEKSRYFLSIYSQEIALTLFMFFTCCIDKMDKGLICKVHQMMMVI